MFGIWSSLMWPKKKKGKNKNRAAFPPLPASVSPSSWSLAGGAGCSPLSGVSAQTLLQPYSSGWGERPRSPCTAQCYLRLAFRWGYLSPPRALQGWPSACTHTHRHSSSDIIHTNITHSHISTDCRCHRRRALGGGSVDCLKLTVKLSYSAILLILSARNAFFPP